MSRIDQIYDFERRIESLLFTVKQNELDIKRCNKYIELYRSQVKMIKKSIEDTERKNDLEKTG